MPRPFRSGWIVRGIILALVAVALCVTGASDARASVPSMVSFQGRLTNTSGDLLGGSSGTNYFFKFALFDSQNGVTQLWPVGTPPTITIKVTQGVFNTLLGDTSAGYSALNVDFNNPSVWLEVEVSSDGLSWETLSPRERIVASGYAINAESVHGGRFINAAGVGQFGSLTTTSYSRFGTDTTTHGLSNAAQALFSDSTEFDGQVFIDNSASISLNLEVAGYASASQYFGAGLSSCSGSGQKLLWSSTTGKFSCGNDQTGSGGALIGVNEIGNSFADKSSISFTASGFTVDTSGDIALIGLDYTNGPASRSISQTITGQWNFTAPGSSSFSGSLNISKGLTANSYQGGGLIACSALQKLTYANGQFSCATDLTGGGGSSSGLEIVESGNAFGTHYGSISFEAGNFNVTFPTASSSLVKLDWINGPASRSATQSITGAWTFGQTITGTTSGNELPLTFNFPFRRVTNAIDFPGYAGWNIPFLTLGNTASLSQERSLAGTSRQIVATDGGANSNLTLSLDSNLFLTNASLSGNFEANTASLSGNFTVNGTGSSSFAGSLNISKGLTANSFQGGGLTACNSISQKLIYSNGQFSCVTDQTGGGGFSGIEIAESGSSFGAHYGSISFDAGAFDVTFPTASSALVKLDWINGPASRALNNTWTGTGSTSFAGSVNITKSITVGGLTANSVNSIGRLLVGGQSTLNAASVSSNLEVAGSLTASTSFFSAGLQACNGSSQKLTWINGLFGCGIDQTGGGGGGSSNLEIREFGAAFDSFPATLSFSSAHFKLTASGSSDVTVGLDWGAGGPASLSADETVTGAWTFGGGLTSTYTGSTSFAGSLNVAKGLTAATYQGGGLTLCNTSGKVLNYAGGLFSCHSLASGDIPDLSATYLPLAGGTLAGNLIGTGASFSAGEFTSYASAQTYTGGIIALTGANSNSFAGSLNITKSLTAAGLTISSLNNTGNDTVSGTGSSSFSGSLNISKSLTVTKSVTAAQFQGTGAASNSFAGSLNITKSITSGGLTASSITNTGNEVLTGTFTGSSANSNSFAGSLNVTKSITSGGITASSLNLSGTGSTSFQGSLNTAKGIHSATDVSGQRLIATNAGNADVLVNNTQNQDGLYVIRSVGGAGSSTFSILSSNSVSLFSIASSSNATFTGTTTVNGVGSSSFLGSLNISKSATITNSVTAATFQGSGVGSSSFAGSLNLSKSLTAGGITIASLNLTSTGSTSFLGSLNLSKSLTVTKSVTADSFQGSGANSNSFAGSLNITKSLTAAGLTISSLNNTGNDTVSGTGSSSFSGSLNISKSLTVTKSVTAAQFQGTGAASNSFAGSLNITKSITSGGLTASSITNTGNEVLTGTFTGSSANSNSFAGSLNVTKSITSGGITASSLNLSGTGSTSFQGSLNTAKGIHSATDVSGQRLIATNAGNADVLVNNTQNQDGLYVIRSVGGAGSSTFSILSSNSVSLFSIASSSNATFTGTTTVNGVGSSSFLGSLNISKSATITNSVTAATFQGSGVGSSSFAGSLNLSKSLTAGGITIASLNLTSTGSTSFLGSLNLSKSLTVTKSVTADSFQGSGANSNSFAGSLNVTKSITSGGLTASSITNTGNEVLTGTFTGSSANSNSFAGSLNVTKSITSGGITASSLNLSGTGSTSFQGSLNTAKGIHSATDVSGQRLIATNAGNADVLVNNTQNQDGLYVIRSVGGAGSSTFSILSSNSVSLFSIASSSNATFTGTTTVNGVGSSSFLGSLNISKSATITNSVTAATFQGSGVGSSSFAGSLNLSKSLTAGGITIASLNLTSTGSTSFLGSLNLSKSLTVTKSVTADSFQGSGANSNSFAGSLNITKSLTAAGLTISSLNNTGNDTVSGTGSSSFSGSLNISKSLTVTKSVTAAQFQGTGAASNSFAGSLNITKSITSGGLTASSITNTGNEVLTGTFTGSSANSNSFAGSLNVTKSITSGGITASSLNLSGTGSTSFQGSLNTAKGIHSATDVSGQRLIATNAGNADVLVNNTQNQDGLYVIRSVGGAGSSTFSILSSNSVSLFSIASSSNATFTGTTTVNGVGSSSFLGSLNISKSATITNSVTAATFQGSGVGSSSFAGSLNLSKSLTAGGITIASLNLTSTGSTSFLGSLNLSKSLTVTKSVTADSFQGSGANSNSFAGSLNVTKSITSGGLTASSITNTGNEVLTGTFTGSSANSNSFAGSLNVTKSITSGGITASSLNLSGTGSTSFQGSLNTAKGIHSATDVSGQRLIATNAGNADVLVNNTQNQDGLYVIRSVGGAGSSTFSILSSNSVSLFSIASSSNATFTGTTTVNGVGSSSFLGSLNISKSATITNSVTAATFQGSGVGSSSFAGSLNLSKSLTAGGITIASLNLTSTGSTSFLGSLNLSKSLTVTKSVTADSFQGSGANSNSFAGSLNITKSLTAAGLTISSLNNTGNDTVSGTGSSSFSGSLNISKSLTVTKSVTAAQFQGTGAASNSFAGSLNITKSITSGGLTASSITNTGNEVLTGTFTGSSANSNSFAGSLNVTKSITSGGITASSLNLSGTGSTSFQGSLNTAKGIHSATDVSGQRLIATNAGNADVLVNNTQNQDGLYVIRSVGGAGSSTFSILSSNSVSLFSIASSSNATFTGTTTVNGVGSSSFLGSLNISKSATITNSVTAATFQGSGVGSSSFAGSLNLSKSLTAGGITIASLNLTSTGSTSFLGSLNLSKSLTVTKSVTADSFQGSGANSNSFAGSLNITKSLTAAGLTISSLNNTGNDTVSGTGSSSFSGSLNISKSLTVTKSVTAAQFQGTGAASNSFAGSLNITKSITSGGLTASSITNTGNEVLTGTFTGSSANSNSFAGSLNVTKSITSGGITASSITNTGNETVAGTGSSSFAGSLNISKGVAALSFQGGGLTECDNTTGKLVWHSGRFSCQTDQTGGVGSGTQTKDDGVQNLAGATKLNFADNAFTLVASGTTETIVKLDWTNGPASRSATQTISGAWTFTAASTQFNTLEFGTASASGVAVFGGTGSSTFAGSLNVTKSLTAGGLTISSLNLTSTGSTSFLGSLNISKSLTAGGITISSLNLTGTGSTSFASSLNIAKSLTVANSITSGPHNITGNFPANNTGLLFSVASTSTLFGVQENGGIAIGTTNIQHNGLLYVDTAARTAASESFGIRANAVAAGSVASISATGLTTGSVFNITVAASGSTSRYKVLSVVDTNGITVASLSNSGGLTINGAFNGNSGASNSFKGSLNISKSLTVTNSITAGLANITGNVPGINTGPLFSVSSTSQLFRIQEDGSVGIGTSILKHNGLLYVDTAARTAASESFGIRANAVAAGSVASISATGLTTGSVFNITVAASGSTSRYKVLSVVDTNGITVASLSNSGGLTINGAFNGNSGASNSFKGSLNISKSLTVGGVSPNFINIANSLTSNPFRIKANSVTSGNIASISATSLSGGSIFNITIPASSGANSPHGIFFIHNNTSQLVIASMSLGGNFAIRGKMMSHGQVITCSFSDPGVAGHNGCIDYAESYPTSDASPVTAGDVVSYDAVGNTLVPATSEQGLLGVISTNPAVLVTGTEVREGVTAGEIIPGTAPVAMAGRVPVKVSTENGPIHSGDYLTVSPTHPGYAAKAVTAGTTIGTALADFIGTNAQDLGTVMVFVNTSYWTPKNPALESLSNNISITTNADGDLAINRPGDTGSTLLKFDTTGNAIFTGGIQASQIQGLTPLANQVSALAAQVAQLQSNTPTPLPQALVDLPETVASLSAQLTGFMVDTRALLTQQDIALASLSARTDLIASTLANVSQQVAVYIANDRQASQSLQFDQLATFNGGLVTSAIGSVGDAVNFMSDAIFFGRPYFNSDAGGFALIPAGQQEVAVTFDQDYQYQPVVNATISVNDASGSSALEDAILAGQIRYIVTRKSVHGFTIKLAAPAPVDLPFDWTALAIHEPKLFMPIVVHTPAPTPVFSVPASPSITPDVTPEVSDTPTPEAPASDSPTPALTP